MSQYRFVASASVFVLRLAGAAALTLTLVHCSAEQSPTDTTETRDGPIASVTQALEHCAGVACAGTADCAANMPACALSAGTGCTQGPPRECVWRLNTSSTSCPCMEHDVRLCDNSGSPGVEICMKDSATATHWGACQTTPACTP